MSKGTRKDGTNVTTFNISLPTELLTAVDVCRGKIPRTSFIEEALRTAIAASDADNLRIHILELAPDEADHVEAYRRISDEPPLSKIAGSAIKKYVDSKLEGNLRMQGEFAVELARVKKSRKPPISIAGEF